MSPNGFHTLPPWLDLCIYDSCSINDSYRSPSPQLHMNQRAFPDRSTLHVFPNAFFACRHIGQADRDYVGTREAGKLQIDSNSNASMKLDVIHHLLHPDHVCHSGHLQELGSGLSLKLIDDFRVVAILSLTPDEQRALNAQVDLFCVAFYSQTAQHWIVPAIPPALRHRFLPVVPADPQGAMPSGTYHTYLLDHKRTFTPAVQAPAALGDVTVFLTPTSFDKPGEMLATTARHRLKKLPTQYSAALVLAHERLHEGLQMMVRDYVVLKWWDFETFEWHDALGNPPPRRSARLSATK